MKEKETVIERGEILSEFNLEEVRDLLNDQINKDFSSMMTTPLDHFKPFYVRYKQMKNMVMNDDLMDDLEEQFKSLCLIFVEKIEERFGIELSDKWIEKHHPDMPAITLMLYQMFVLELAQNIEDAIHHSILVNYQMLYQMFEDRKSKKDASTSMYSKLLNPEKALLMANIYDVSTYVIEHMDEDEFFDGLPEGYVPKEVIQKLYNKGNIMGGFMDEIRAIFENSDVMKSNICFNIEFKYRNSNAEEPETAVSEEEPQA